MQVLKSANQINLLALARFLCILPSPRIQIASNPCQVQLLDCSYVLAPSRSYRRKHVRVYFFMFCWYSTTYYNTLPYSTVQYSSYPKLNYAVVVLCSFFEDIIKNIVEATVTLVDMLPALGSSPW